MQNKVVKIINFYYIILTTLFIIVVVLIYDAKRCLSQMILQHGPCKIVDP